MEKKDLKFYESPVVEMMDIELEGQLLQASGAEVPDYHEEED